MFELNRKTKHYPGNSSIPSTRKPLLLMIKTQNCSQSKISKMLQPFFFNVYFIHFQNKNHSSVTVAPLEVSETMTGD